MRTGLLQLEVDGERIETWTTYRIGASVLGRAADWQASILARGSASERTRLRELLLPGKRVAGYVRAPGNPSVRTLQFTGFVEQLSVSNDPTGTRLDVSGRDLSGHLFDSCVPMSAIEQSGTNFVDLVRDLVAPWDIEVWLDATASRHIATGQVTTTAAGRLARQRARRMGIPAGQFSDTLARAAAEARAPIDGVYGSNQAAVERAARRARKGAANSLTSIDIQRIRIDEAMPQTGETVWEFILRHATRFGLMVWFDPRGRLVLSSPNYDEQPTFRLVRRVENDARDPNNVAMGGQTLSIRDSYSGVVVYGRTASRDASRSRFSFSAVDDSMPYPKLLVVHDNTVKSQEEAKRAATRALGRFAVNRNVLDFTVYGHGDGRHTYAIDTIYEVADEVTGVFDSFYCVERTFSCSREEGTMTNLRLIPRYSLQL